ncbi:MAG: AAA family ATPase, partial [Stackebrandtia sp.]
MLFGRDGEKHAIDAALAAARDGSGAALVLHGVPGTGKSALLEHAAGAASDMTVLRTAGVQVEAELPYAALHMLLRPLLKDVGALPTPQAAALRRAFGMESEGEANRFAVGLATLTLLSEAAEPKPVACLVDDAQWLDLPSAHAIGFAARRLDADRVAVLFATRTLSRDHQLDGLPQLPVPGLDHAAAVALLDAAGVAARLREHLITTTEGNPLALRELGRTAATATEHSALAMPMNRTLQDVFAADIDKLGTDARTLLLVAAAEDTGDLDVVLRAAEA